MESSNAPLGSTKRTTLHRVPHKEVKERGALYALVDTALVGHVGIIDGGQPFVIPVAIARDGDNLLLHGSKASRLFKLLASGAPCAVSITILDALVLARSAFESSMNYRSALILGRALELDGDEKIRAFEVLTDHLLPERRPSLRPLNDAEIRQTSILSISMEEASVKISSKFPADSEEDLSWPVWAGNIPIHHSYGAAIPDPRMTEVHPLPEYIKRWPEGRT
ncbi:MAG: pyridoxamine 5'-phosphate oxidase family protein [Actinobacteria bacterium]|nr:pyridoxamine 5'-phosphate oxidase family protein [Actinomycetota bacterium]